MAPQLSSVMRAVRPTTGMRRALVVAVLLPYLAALALPAVTGDIDAPNTTAPGIQALMMGWIFNPIAWLANVLLPAGVLRSYKGRFKSAVMLGVAAWACAAIPLVWPQGLELESGYYVWVSAMAMFVLGASLLWYGQRRASERAGAGP